VPAVGEFKGEREKDDGEEEREARHGAWFVVSGE
jgi:hypothetical protein